MLTRPLRPVPISGRDRDHLKLPAALVVVGETVEEEQTKMLQLDALAHYESGVTTLSIAPGTDASEPSAVSVTGGLVGTSDNRLQHLIS